MGAHIDSMVVGLVASILVSFTWPAINDRRKASAAVAFSALAAGYFAPVLAAYLPTLLVGLNQSIQLELAIAVAIGAATPTTMPFLFRRLARTAEGV